MKRIELAALIGMIVAVLLSAFTAFAGDCADVRQQVLRLHVMANSNSNEDQALKLAVRDAVLEGTARLFSDAHDKSQIEENAAGHLSEIQALAQAEILRQGYDYPVEAQLVNMFFDTRAYGELTLPAGYYDAVRITIGSGEGKNWWCMMFPPMCIPAASPGDGGPLEEQIRELEQHPQYEPKFAVVELLETVSQKWGHRGERPVVAVRS